MPIWWLGTCLVGLLILFKIYVVRAMIAAMISQTIGMRYGPPESVAEFICSVCGLLGFALFFVGGFQVMRWKNQRDDDRWSTR